DGLISLSNKLDLKFDKSKNLITLLVKLNSTAVLLKPGNKTAESGLKKTEWVLFTVNNQNNTFKMTSPHLRSVILRYFLKYCSSNEILNHDAVCIFYKENIRLAPLHSRKKAQVPVDGSFNVLGAYTNSSFLAFSHIGFHQ
ncbi:12691_t:CDS:2, partial [Funneliformis mosseae]